MQIDARVVLEDYVYQFYAKIARQACKTPEQVMADALVRLAGELVDAALPPRPRPLEPEDKT